MNYFTLKHYYFYFSCDCKWHKINFLDGLFGKSVAQNFGFGGRRNEDGVYKRRVNARVLTVISCVTFGTGFLRLAFQAFGIALTRP